MKIILSKKEKEVFVQAKDIIVATLKGAGEKIDERNPSDDYKGIEIKEVVDGARIEIDENLIVDLVSHYEKAFVSILSFVVQFKGAFNSLMLGVEIQGAAFEAKWKKNNNNTNEEGVN